MPALALLFLATTSAPPALSPLELRLRGDDMGVELTLSGPTVAVRRAEVVETDGRLVVFFPGVRLSALDRRFDRGPVRAMRTRVARRGSVLVILPRRRARALRRRLRLLPGDPSRLVVEAASQAPAGNAVEARPAPSPDGEHVSQALSRKVASAEARHDPRAPLSLRPAEAGLAPSIAPRLLPVLLVLLLAAGAVGLLRRRRRTEGGDTSIDIVAVRPFGGKHRLALVEADGERLLLAASDREVRLLSVVGGQSLHAAGPQDGEAPIFEDALEDLTSAPDVRGEPTGATANRDIQGLLRLRNRLAQRSYRSRIEARA